MFERLKEQKALRQNEIVIGLDEDDANFLNTAAERKVEREKKISAEDNSEIQDFRKRVREIDEEEKTKVIKVLAKLIIDFYHFKTLTDHDKNK